MDQATIESWVRDWPGVTQDIKWHDDLVFMVAGKMFCVFCFQGQHRGQVSFKVEDERFLEFTDRPHVIPAPYMARAHWISVLSSAAMPIDELKALVRHSYVLVRAKLPKKTQRELGSG
ncbi:MAG: MmcQ/YjbR family DNA-binding protein [Xanthomonadales bacterium]|nr:MmcQ/YjbR family DNA-binding protein [Xanthomonadales bacterium]MBP6078795.1 MmcQ/YjbR family DNA-binding protein [Xanthomonadales bacterium]MBP7623000.1 MmcQ/YjbR family DNA-binding protein [Xanthomonadales bacterium]